MKIMQEKIDNAEDLFEIDDETLDLRELYKKVYKDKESEFILLINTVALHDPIDKYDQTRM
jgi:hypothetical protein